MDVPAVTLLSDCMETYHQAVKEVAAQLRPGDGLLGFGRDPKKDPCHMAFYEAVRAAVDRMAREGLPPQEAEAAVEYLLTLCRDERYHSLTQPMREAVQGHARPLVPLLEPEAARALAARYAKAYPRFRRLPVQAQLLRELERRAKGRG